MKYFLVFVLLILHAPVAFAQKTPANPFAKTDKLALALPDSGAKSVEGIARYINAQFSTNEEKVRAAFIWVAHHIAYDVDDMFTIHYEKSSEVIASQTLKAGKGVCSGYAALFYELCTQLSIPGRIVEGYTKQSGYIDFVPHAWCAALVDSTWYLFDPTWASGYVNNEKFTRKLNNTYFKAKPEVLIRSHMPFDFLWQFMPYPWTTAEFYKGSALPNDTKTFFNYKDSIAAYDRLTHIEQLESTVSRMERNGVKNAAAFERLKFLKTEIQILRQNQTVDLYNAAIYDYNEGVYAFNAFIKYRNSRFIPPKSDADIQEMLNTVDTHLASAYMKLDSIQKPDPSTTAMMKQSRRTMEDFEKELKGQQDWLSLYFSKGKSGRKSMFYKYTWFGMPLN